MGEEAGQVSLRRRAEERTSKIMRRWNRSLREVVVMEETLRILAGRATGAEKCW